jgi:hypothetical protein
MVRSSMPLPRAISHNTIELFILRVSKYVIFVNWLSQTLPIGSATSEPNNN